MTVPDVREFQEVRAGLLDDEFNPVQVSVNTTGASVWSNGRNRPIVLTNEGRIVARNAGLTPPVGQAVISAISSEESDDITDRISVGVARYHSGRDLFSNHVNVGIAQALADPDSGQFLDFTFDPEWNEGVPDSQPPFIDFLSSPESKGGFTISGLETLLGDHATDEYDKIAILIYSWTAGEWFVVETIDVSELDSYGYEVSEVTITKFRAAGGADNRSFYPGYTPNQSYVFPAVRSLRTMTVGGQQRLVGAHMAGFDPFKDTPPLLRTTAAERIDSDGVLTLSVPGSLADLMDTFRDGTHLIVGLDESGEEIVRGFIARATSDYYAIVSDLDDTVLEFNQVQVCRTFDRDTVYTQDGDQGDGPQTWIIRRQVVASVENGKRELKLFHDVDLTIPAKVAGQYWVHGLATIRGIGTGFVDKVHTVDGTWHGSLNDGEEVGTGLMLRNTWAWPSGSGFFSVEGRSRVVFVGRGDRNTFDTTGLGFEIPTLSRTSIMAIENFLGNLLVLTQIGQAYVLNPSPFADPTTFELAVEFDVREAVPDQMLTYNGTCVSNETWVYQNGAVGWIGSEGPWALDGVKFTDLADQEISKLWGRVPTSVLARSCSVVDQSHKSGAVIRFGGMRHEVSGRNDVQFALHLERGHWLDYTGSAAMDSAAVVQMDDGGQRVLFGGRGRLWLYGDQFNSRFAFPHVPKTRFGTVSRLRDGSGLPILETHDGDFVRWGGGRFWDRAGIRVAVVNDLGEIMLAQVETIQPSGELAVTPISGPWVMATGRTYRFVIGPRLWTLELPWRTAAGGFSGVEAEMFQFDATDVSDFDWSLRFRLQGSLRTPNLDDATDVSAKTKVDRILTRARFLAQNNAIRMATGSDHRVRLTFTGLHPPDCHLQLRRILVGLRYHGRL
jgi:hypothetical protein